MLFRSVVDVLATDRGPRVTISRTHPGLVKRMFELEVPEIYDGTVEVKAIAREAGARTKLAVWSQNPDVDPVGACIGARGVRREKVGQELNGGRESRGAGKGVKCIFLQSAGRIPCLAAQTGIDKWVA